jgi:hypothetical protein
MMLSLSRQSPVTNPDPSLGNFKKALPGNFWRAPKHCARYYVKKLKVITKGLTKVVKRTHGGFMNTVVAHLIKSDDRWTAEAVPWH